MSDMLTDARDSTASMWECDIYPHRAYNLLGKSKNK